MTASLLFITGASSGIGQAMALEWARRGGRLALVARRGDDMRAWARILATGKLLSPAMKAAQQQFLPAPEEGVGSLYGLALENQNGWLGHNGNVLSYMAFPYYLPDERITLVVLLNSATDVPATWRMMEEIAPIVSPTHPWPGLPKE